MVCYCKDGEDSGELLGLRASIARSGGEEAGGRICLGPSWHDATPEYRWLSPDGDLSPGFEMSRSEVEEVFLGPAAYGCSHLKDWEPPEDPIGTLCGKDAQRVQFDSVGECYLVCFLLFLGCSAEAATAHGGKGLSDKQRESVRRVGRRHDHWIGYWERVLSDYVLGKAYEAMLCDRQNGGYLMAFLGTGGRLLWRRRDEWVTTWMGRFFEGMDFRVDEDMVWRAGSGPEMVLMRLREGGVRFF